MSLRVPVSGRVLSSGRIAASGRLMAGDNARSHDTLKAYLSKQANLVAYWPLDDVAGVYNRIVNPALSEGRDICINGNMSSSTGWSVPAGWVIAGGVATHTSGTNNAIASTVSAIGHLYKVTFDITVVAGTLTVSGGGIARSATGSFTDFIIGTGGSVSFQPSTTFDGTLDNVVIKEIGIKASSQFPNVELVINGAFDWDLGWTKGAGITIAGGLCVFTAVTAGVQATQVTSMIIGRSYDITYTLVVASGTARIRAGSGATGATRTLSGTYTETLTCTTGTAVALDAVTTFTGSFDNVSIVPHDGLIIWNGDGSTTTGWAAVNSATLSSTGGKLRVAYNAVANAGATQISLKQGSTYILTIDMNGDGTAIPSVICSTTLLTGTASATPQSLSTPPFVAASATLLLRNTTSSGFVEFDNIVVIEVPPMVTTISGAVLNQNTSHPLTDPAVWEDGINDFLSAYSIVFNSTFNPNLIVIGVLFQAANTGIWTDGTLRTLWRIQGAAGDIYVITKSATNNTLSFSATAGGVNIGINHAISDANLHLAEMVIDTGAGTMMAFIDGQQTGATQSGLLPWTSNLITTNTIIGAGGNTGGNPWSGYLNHAYILRGANIPAQRTIIAQLAGVRDN